jgi:hypothetical protein
VRQRRPLGLGFLLAISLLAACSSQQPVSNGSSTQGQACAGSGALRITISSTHPAYTATLPPNWEPESGGTEFYCSLPRQDRSRFTFRPQVIQEAVTVVGLYPIPTGQTVGQAIAALRSTAAEQDVGSIVPWTVARHQGVGFDITVLKPFRFADYGFDCWRAYSPAVSSCGPGLRMRVGAIPMDGVATPDGPAAGFTVIFFSVTDSFAANLKSASSFLDSIQVTPAPTLPATAREVLDLSGQGPTVTDKFSVSGKNWKLTWSYDCGSLDQAGAFFVTVAPAGQTPVQFGLKGSDTEYFDSGPGAFSLTIATPCRWHVVVTG